MPVRRAAPEGPLAPPEGLVAEVFVVDGAPHVAFHWEVSGEVAMLTAAERQVATLVVTGASNSRIAKARNASVRTVANQIASIFRKLGVRSRYELTARFAGVLTA